MLLTIIKSMLSFICSFLIKKMLKVGGLCTIKQFNAYTWLKK